MKSISEVLKDVLKDSQAVPAQAYSLLKMKKSWESILGKDVACHCAPLSYKSGCLVIGVSSSVALQELTFIKEMLRKKINHAMEGQQVMSVQFVLRETLDKA